MTLFDLLFILLLLLSIATLSLAALLALLGRRAGATRLLQILAVCAAGYFGIVLIVSLLIPRQTLSIGEPLCFDDWCITVAGVHSTTRQSAMSYVVEFRLSSRARRVTQRENNLAVYLSDDQGNRYDPVPGPLPVPFDTPLRPHESALATRTFDVPAGVQVAGLVIAHEGGFPIDWFIIAHGPFQDAPILLLDE